MNKAPKYKTLLERKKRNIISKMHSLNTGTGNQTMGGKRLSRSEQIIDLDNQS